MKNKLIICLILLTFFVNNSYAAQPVELPFNDSYQTVYLIDANFDAISSSVMFLGAIMLMYVSAYINSKYGNQVLFMISIFIFVDCLEHVQYVNDKYEFLILAFIYLAIAYYNVEKVKTIKSEMLK